jgi:hypothetical protein
VISAGRTVSLLAWAALIAAWALPQNVTVQNSSSDFVANEKAVDSVKAFAAEGAELVDHLGEELLPEDYSALANPNMRGLLPPVEYAHPYRGTVMLLRGQSQEALRRICGERPGVLLGCARRPNAGELPFVVLADRATVVQNGWTENLNELHEAGHLNGSWAHDGWRDLATLGAPAATPRATKPIVVAQADVPSVPSGRPEAIEDDQAEGGRSPYDEPLSPPRRRPPPRYYEPPPIYGPPPGWIVIPGERRAMPCLPTLLTFGALRFCI